MGGIGIAACQTIERRSRAKARREQLKRRPPRLYLFVQSCLESLPQCEGALLSRAEQFLGCVQPKPEACPSCARAEIAHFLPKPPGQLLP